MFPPNLALVRLRLTLRLLGDGHMPAAKGAMLRGGFGYAFQRRSCPQPCWGATERCTLTAVCPFRAVYEPARPEGVTNLHDLRDAPRAFVISSTDARTDYMAGDALEFTLTLIGHGIDHLPYFYFGFEQLGSMGLGRDSVRSRLERVEALHPWQATGTVIYQDGRALLLDAPLPLLDADAISVRAATLPANMRLTLAAPLRLKSGGAVLRQIDLPAIVRAICWRLNALSLFYSSGPWPVDHRALVAQAAQVVVEPLDVRWDDLLRTSTRGGTPHTMPHGGIVGSAILRQVPPDIRAILLAGSLVHVGKACTFGHGKLLLGE